RRQCAAAGTRPWEEGALPERDGHARDYARDRAPISVPSLHPSGPLAGTRQLRLRDLGNLPWWRRTIAAVPIAVAIPVSVPVTIAVSRSARIILGQYRANHRAARVLEAPERGPHHAHAHLATANDEDGRRRRARKQGGVGKTHHGRTVKDNKVKDLEPHRQ